MIEKEECHKYDDIIDLPHYYPPDKPRMSRLARAAQFAPFAALTGHDAAIEKAKDAFNKENYGDELNLNEN